MSAPLIIAHRGDSSRALENSLEAVRIALSLPADMIELDLRRSRDNRLYVMHDKDTGRTAEQDIDIEDSEADAIAGVRLRNGEPVPLLTDVLGLVAGRVPLNLEIKSAGAGGLCAAQVSGSGYAGQVLISSFQEREVLDARRIAPGLSFSGIFDDFVLRDLERYASSGCSIISLRKRTVTPELIVACRARKIKVFVWTVDNEAEMRQFLEWGVDGIYSNKPSTLKEVIERTRTEGSV